MPAPLWSMLLRRHEVCGEMVVGSHATASKTTAVVMAAVAVGTFRSAPGMSGSPMMLAALGMVREGGVSVWTQHGVLLLVAESSVLLVQQDQSLLLLRVLLLKVLACCSGVALLDQRRSTL